MIMTFNITIIERHDVVVFVQGSRSEVQVSR